MKKETNKFLFNDIKYIEKENFDGYQLIDIKKVGIRSANFECKSCGFSLNESNISRRTAKCSNCNETEELNLF